MTSGRNEIPPSDRVTRSQSKTQVPSQGGDFVDYNYDLIMRSYPCTLFAFQQDHVHGGTLLHRIQQTGAAITITKAVVDAYKAALEQQHAGLTVNHPDPEDDIGVLGLELESLTLIDE